MTRAAAFKNARGEPATQPVRVAGQEAMRDKPLEWDKLDDTIDDSFPASDPPAFNTRGIKRKDERVLRRAKRKKQTS